MIVKNTLDYYRSLSHTLLTAMLNDRSYCDSLTEEEKDDLYGAWEEHYMVEGSILCSEPDYLLNNKYSKLPRFPEYRYRPHRGALVDSLSAQCSFTSIASLFDYISKVQYNSEITSQNLSYEPYSLSDNHDIGWFNTHIVIVDHPKLGRHGCGFLSFHLCSFFGTYKKGD